MFGGKYFGKFEQNCNGKERDGQCLSKKKMGITPERGNAMPVRGDVSCLLEAMSCLLEAMSCLLEAMSSPRRRGSILIDSRLRGNDTLLHSYLRQHLHIFDDCIAKP